MPTSRTANVQSEVPDVTAFRARLQSQSVAAESPKTKSAKLASHARDVFHDKVIPGSTSHFVKALESFQDGQDGQDDEITGQLKSASIKASAELHESILKALQDTREEIDDTVNEFAASASAFLSSTKALYSNIEHPLSATLCSSLTAPRTTITGHCLSLQNDIQAKLASIEELKSEWTRCVQREDELWKQLLASGQDTMNVKRDGHLPPNLQALQRETQAIVQAAEEEINDMEAEFRDTIRTETVEMVSLMM